MKFLVLLVMLVGGAVQAETKCTAKTEVIQEAKTSEKVVFLKWLGAQKHEDYLYQNGVENLTVWYADINNDGTKEWISADYQGSGGYLYLQIFQAKGSEFKNIGDIPWPVGSEEHDGGWYSHNDKNFLVKMCDQTYFVMMGDLGGQIDGYLWKDGKNRLACDQPWTNYLTDQFQKQYDQKNYVIARNILEPYFNNCSEKLASESKLKMMSDLMLTAFHSADRQKCLAVAADAKKEKTFSTSKFQKAILHNEELCKGADQVSKLHFDSKVKLDEVTATDEVLLASVPDIGFISDPLDHRASAWVKAGIIKKNGVPRDHHRFDLRDQVRNSLWLGDSNQIVDKRYVILTGCIPHDCGDKGFLWIDTKEGNTVFATNYSGFSEKKRDCLTIGSRTLEYSKLPKEFWASFKKWWGSDNVSTSKCGLFVDGTSKEVQINEVSLTNQL